MNRRSVLVSLAFGGLGALAGCVGSSPVDSRSTPDPVPGIGTPEDPCPDGIAVDVELENRSSAERTVTVSVGSEVGSADNESADFSLDPGERGVWDAPVETGRTYTVTVDVSEGPTDEWTWQVESCRRLGVSVDGDDLTYDLVEPLHGPGDGLHDCYAGDPVSVRIRNETDAPHTVRASARTADGPDVTVVETVDSEDIHTDRELLTYGTAATLEVRIDEETEEKQPTGEVQPATFEWDDPGCGVVEARLHREEHNQLTIDVVFVPID